jgi:hypothetical protein
MSNTLVDSSFLVALGYPRDRNHVRAKTFAAAQYIEMLVPDVVLVEAVYNLQRLGGVKAAARFASLLLAQQVQFVPLTKDDFIRTLEIMTRYQDAELDFVDCCLTALAERLGITQICTFDRRDFSIIRPKHTSHFDLLP